MRERERVGSIGDNEPAELWLWERGCCEVDVGVVVVVVVRSVMTDGCWVFLRVPLSPLHVLSSHKLLSRANGSRKYVFVVVCCAYIHCTHLLLLSCQ